MICLLLLIPSVYAFDIAGWLSGLFGWLQPEAITTTTKVAYPQFGSVCCEITGHWSTINRDMVNHPTYTLNSYVEYECATEECELQTPTVVCPSCWASGRDPYYAVWINNICYGSNTGTLFASEGCTKTPLIFPVKFYKGDKVKVMATCNEPFFCGSARPTSSSVTIKVQEQKLYYYFNGARVDQERSEGCQRNDLVNTYLNEQPEDSIKGTWDKLKQYLPITWLKADTEATNSLYDLPVNLQAGDCYLFLYRWEEVPDLNLISYDSTGDGVGDMYVYCDIYSKEIYKWEEIITESGSKYYVPTEKLTLAGRTYPCCVPEDCRYLGAEWTCNIHTFNCEPKYFGNPCNSVFDCGAEYTSGEVCEYKNGKYMVTIWGCDFSKPQTGYKGTCVLASEREVKCCKWSCAGDEYCDYEEGCKKQVTLLPCGTYGEYCCKEGGNYKPQQCPPGLICCFQIGSDYRGVCKEKCEPTLICDGDGICEPEKGETSENCPSDCKPVIPECYQACDEKHPYAWEFLSKMGCYMGCWFEENKWYLLLIGIIIIVFVALLGSQR